MPSNTPIQPDEAKRRRDETIQRAHELNERRLKAWDAYNPRKPIDDPNLGREYFLRFVAGEQLTEIAESAGYRTYEPIVERIESFARTRLTETEFHAAKFAPWKGGGLKLVKHFAQIFHEKNITI